MRTWIALVLALTATLAHAQSDTNQTMGTLGYWTNRVAQVKVGMTRAEVEKLLPPLPDSPCPSMSGGGSMTMFYWVETNLVVRVTYGNNSSHTASLNKLLFEPILSEQPLPAGKPKK